jgi:hypothetical protein
VKTGTVPCSTSEIEPGITVLRRIVRVRRDRLDESQNQLCRALRRIAWTVKHVKREAVAGTEIQGKLSQKTDIEIIRAEDLRWLRNAGAAGPTVDGQDVGGIRLTYGSGKRQGRSVLDDTGGGGGSNQQLKRKSLLRVSQTCKCHGQERATAKQAETHLTASLLQLARERSKQLDAEHW